MNERIVIDPRICHGKPVVRGTRTPVTVILSALAVGDIGLGTAPDMDIADHAKIRQLSLISSDQDFGNILDYPPTDYSGIVVVNPPPGATRVVILRLVEQFLQQSNLVDQLAGRLV